MQTNIKALSYLMFVVDFALQAKVGALLNIKLCII
jgi:hypothetical protein